MSSTSSVPREVSVTQLGLSSDEVAVLQHAQREAAAGSSSSRAASRASSQGVLILDSGSLAQLGRHFDRLMQQISQQLDYLTEQSQIVTVVHYDAAGNLIDNADAEIRRYHQIIAQIDELEAYTGYREVVSTEGTGAGARIGKLPFELFEEPSPLE
ncbi:hypothetical protein N0V82_002952 [Gnomoniopsis sp. IMI 355080]|nr:hypothetical protein N0V82_002952 [Gnomoniopsis sp. IMI 355080]